MTVIVLTSGTSWAVPPDWTAVNKVETFGAGGGGGGALTTNAVGSGAGGSGGYSTSSNIAGLSGTLTISIGTAGTAGASTNTAGGAGGPTWFNGANQAASTVSANGGLGGAASLGSGTAAGGAGASTTGATGTSKTAGSAGGDGSATRGWAGGGAGAPGPDGAGAAGNTGGVADPTQPGDGGTGDNALGGAGGTHGTNPSPGAGGAGTANTNGGGGGGGAADQGGTGGGPGGAGALPGGGGGGQSSLTTSGAGGAGGGGQIRITYTPSVLNTNGCVSTTLPPFDATQKKKGPASPTGYDYFGWRSQPLSKNTVPGFMWTAVPIGRFNPFNYLDWKLAPQGAPTNNTSCIYDLPVRSWKTRGHLTDYAGWFQSPIPKEFLVPLPSADVPKGVYNNSAYQDWQHIPQPLGIQPGPASVVWNLPLTLDPRHSYGGQQASPRPATTQVPQPLPWTSVPAGIWSIAAYQSHTAGYQRAEFAAPLSVTGVPKGAVLYDYSGWKSFQPPIPGPVPIQSSRSTDLPVLSSLEVSKRSPVYYQGAQVLPLSPPVVPSGTVCWLPLVYVGNTPIAGGNQHIDAKQGNTVHSLPPVGPNLSSWIYNGTQAAPSSTDNLISFTNTSTDVPRSTLGDGRWNFKGTQMGPTLDSNATSFGNTSYAVPVGVRSDGRYSYRGTQQSPVSAASVVSLGNRSTTVPLPKRGYDFTGFQGLPTAVTPNVFLGPFVVPFLFFSSNVTAVPAGNSSNPRWDYKGTQAGPLSAPSVGSRPRFWWHMPEGRTSDRRFNYSGHQLSPRPPSDLMMTGLVTQYAPGLVMTGLVLAHISTPRPVFEVPTAARRSFAYMGSGRGPSRWE